MTANQALIPFLKVDTIWCIFRNYFFFTRKGICISLFVEFNYILKYTVFSPIMSNQGMQIAGFILPF